jgi:hypothetical protein
MIAVGVPACGVKGRLARLLHRKRARTQRSGGVRGSTGVGFAARVRWREAGVPSNWDERSTRRDGDGRVAGRLARWLRRGRSNQKAYSPAQKRVLVELLDVSHRPPPHARCEAQGVGGPSPRRSYVVLSGLTGGPPVAPPRRRNRRGATVG